MGKVGCARGLVCGVDNCAKFHELGVATGITAASDCCERENPGCKSWCAPHKEKWTKKCTFKSCLSCPECSVPVPTTKPARPPACKKWCALHKAPWSKKCTFGDCNPCPQCAEPTPAAPEDDCIDYCT